ncbi:MAG: gluconate 2-dehydrogenase subunit 3 family protein [Acidobacteria bacterium]|nr:gluconate 2-dehydrogenase subunit 3 family protein [Acidobacteriota bacterium]
MNDRKKVLEEKAESSRRLEDRRRALKQIGALSGLCALDLLCGPELKAAVIDLVEISHPKQARLQPTTAEMEYRPLATGTVPKSFTRGDLDLLGDLVELIIPTTDTPGARAAGVHWYIDAVAEVNTQVRQSFSEGLAWLRERSQQHFDKPFGVVTESQRVELLTHMSRLPATDPGKQFFELAKQWTLDGYYKSQIGLLQELGWVGHEYLPSFPGCPHPDPSHRRKGAAGRFLQEKDA